MPRTASSANTMPVGFIGLGLMGGPMARHLARKGVPLLVHDLNPRAVRSVVACGARAAASPEAVASSASLVFTCLPSLDALRQVVLGPRGLCRGRAIKTYVDLSSTGSAFARELSAALKPHGVAMLDSPITGGGVKNAAVHGQLTIMVSGPRAAYRHAEPVLKQLGNLVVYIGAKTGQAQTMKLLNNMFGATAHAASCEAFILGVKAGLDPDRMLEVINAGEASSSTTRNRFPRAILPRTFDFGARMAISAKDTTLCLEEADHLGVPTWILQSVREAWAYAISQGGTDKDSSALITFFEPWAGVEVRGHAALGGQAAAQMNAGKGTCGDILLLCEARQHKALSARLRAQGHDVPQRMPENAGVLAFLAAWQSARAGTVVNLCPMAAAQSEALSAAFKKHSVAYLDAPLTGVMDDAGRGTLTVIASGTKAAFARAQPLLDIIGNRVFYMGTQPGAAQLMQQINGSLASTLLAVACEIYVTGVKAGLTPELMARIFANGSGSNAASARIFPQQVVTRRFQHGKRIADACRELALMSDEASRRGVTQWVGGKTRQLYALAAQLGAPQDDVTRLVMRYEKWAKVQVRAAGNTRP